MRNIFRGKSYTKCGGETTPKIKIEHISGSIVKIFMQFVFFVYQVYSYQNILKLSCRPLAFISYKAFSKKKKRPKTSLPASFSA